MLNIDTDGFIQLDVSNIVGVGFAILGIPGTGKSYTTGKLIEQVSPSIPFSIIDLEGEYWTLRQAYPFLIVGKSPRVDITVQPEQAGELARFALENNVSLILDLSGFDDERDQSQFLIAYLRALFALELTMNKPHFVVFEEAHELAPQQENTPLKTIIRRIARRGRKRGLGMIVTSQFSQDVDKRVLGAASVYFLHRVVHPSDRKVYHGLIPMLPAKIDEQLDQLQPGQALFVYGGTVHLVKIAARQTQHGGATPDLGQNSTAAVGIAPEMLEHLRAALEQPDRAKHEQGDGDERLLARISLLERELLVARLQIPFFDKSLAMDSQEGGNALLAPTLPIVAINTLASVGEANGQNDDIPAALVVNEKLRDGVGKALDETYVSPRQKALFAGNQERKFNQLLRSIRNLVPAQRTILAYLISRELGATTFSVFEIAKGSGLAISTVQERIRRHDFLDTPFLEVVDGVGSQRYRTCLNSYLKEHFPDLDINKLSAQIYSIVGLAG